MNISLDWFKSKRKIELEKLQIEQEELKKQLLQQQLSSVQNITPNEKPYLKIKLVNNMLTILLNDGNIVSKTEATIEDYNNIKKAKTEAEIFIIIGNSKYTEELSKEQEIQQKNEKINKGIQVLYQIDDFIVDGENVYLTGINRTIPPLLVESFIDVVNKHNCDSVLDWNDALQEDEEFISLKRFFMWCCLNPRAEVADQLYNFLTENSFRLTKQGFFVALRNVVTVSEDTSYVEFISNYYTKIKSVWKKSPKNYIVYTSDDFDGYKVAKKEEVCTKAFQDRNHSVYTETLEELYNSLSSHETNRYTDAHTKTFDIRVGQLVNMPMEDCSWSTVDCGEKGLK